MQKHAHLSAQNFYDAIHAEATTNYDGTLRVLRAVDTDIAENLYLREMFPSGSHNWKNHLSK